MNTDKKSFDFWNDHSLEFLEMAMKRDHQERVKDCDGYGSATRGCGDTIEFFLTEKEGLIDAISYDLSGCIFSHACVNTIIMMAMNIPLEKAKQINPNDIIMFLKTLPEAETHCADHALSAFHMALESLEKKGK